MHSIKLVRNSNILWVRTNAQLFYAKIRVIYYFLDGWTCSSSCHKSPAGCSLSPRCVVHHSLGDEGRRTSPRLLGVFHNSPFDVLIHPKGVRCLCSLVRSFARWDPCLVLHQLNLLFGCAPTLAVAVVSRYSTETYLLLPRMSRYSTESYILVWGRVNSCLVPGTLPKSTLILSISHLDRLS